MPKGIVIKSTAATTNTFKNIVFLSGAFITSVTGCL